MTAAFQQILDLVDRYLSSRDFWALWRPIAGPDVDATPIDQLTTDESTRYDELYDLVYMGQPNSATAAERSDGLRGGEQLRARIAAWR